MEWPCLIDKEIWRDFSEAPKTVLPRCEGILNHLLNLDWTTFTWVNFFPWGLHSRTSGKSWSMTRKNSPLGKQTDILHHILGSCDLVYQVLPWDWCPGKSVHNSGQDPGMEWSLKTVMSFKLLWAASSPLCWCWLLFNKQLFKTLEFSVIQFLFR